MWAFSKACSSGRTLQPSPSSTEYQQRLRDKSIKHPPPGKQAKGSSSNQVLESSRCSDSNTQARDADPKPQALHRPAASECPPPHSPTAGEVQRPCQDDTHPSIHLSIPPSSLHPRLRDRTKEAFASGAPSRATGASQLRVSRHREARHSWKLSTGQERRVRSGKSSPGEA